MKTILKLNSKRSILLIMFMLLFTLVSCSANGELTIQEIIDYQKTIDSEKGSYSKMEVELDNLSPEGGLVIGYIFANKVRYMETLLFAEMSRMSFKTYIMQDGNFISLWKNEKYDQPYYLEGSKIIETVEETILFSKDSVFLIDFKKLSKHEDVTKDRYRKYLMTSLEALNEKILSD